LVAAGLLIPRGNEAPAVFEEEMGIIMKKLVLAAAVLAVTAGSALAADMAVKAKAPPPARSIPGISPSARRS